jgi:hypothetical protein
MPRIDYSIRPAKTIERKMLAEAFRRLSKLEAPEKYRYVGFGGLYFRDFSLFHRALGISDMLSIEHCVNERKRFEFNRPFHCIKMRFGQSKTELPKIALDEKKNIVWLDYERQLNRDILADVEYVCSKALGGSVLVVTVNAGSYFDQDQECDADTNDDDEADDAESPRSSLNLTPLEELRKILGVNVPLGTTSADLAGEKIARLYRRIIDNKIQATLTSRNGGLINSAAGKFTYLPLFDFQYADGAKMLTTGGIIYTASQANDIKACDFDGLEYCNANNHPFPIPTPRLTVGERRYLNALLPRTNPAEVVLRSVPPKDLSDYIKVYRYFPYFSEVDI